MDPFAPGSPPSSPTNSISLASLVSGHTPRTVLTPGPSSRVSAPSHPPSQTGRSQLNAASDVSEGTPTAGASSPAGRHALTAHMLLVLEFLDLREKKLFNT